MPNEKKLSLKERVFAFFFGEIPVSKRTIYNYRAAPLSLAAFMDVDRIHQIFSDAETGNVMDLFALYRDVLISDAHLQGEFSKRKLAVLGDAMSVQPEDKANPDDVAAAKFIDAQIKDCPRWLNACAHLLDGVLWPLAVVEKLYTPTMGGYKLRGLVPVPDQLLDYRYGKLMIKVTDPDSGYPTGELWEPDPTRYIIHRGHLLSTPDNWGGPMRSLVFWWFFSMMDRDSWGRFIERYGSPFLTGKYEQGDDQSRTELEQAFSNATKLFGLVISKETEVELMQAMTSQGGDAFEKFHTIAQREKSKLIVGQTLSSDAQSTGLGSGVAAGQENVRQDIRQFDAMMLRTTLRDGLFVQLLQANGMPGRPPRVVWGSETADTSDAIGRLLVNLSQAGLQVSDASLPVIGERLGFEIQRAQSAPSVPGFGVGLLPFDAKSDRRYAERAHAAMDRIARGGSADLARAFRGTYAPVRRMILESKSPEELEASLREFAAEWPACEAADLIEHAMLAFTADGTLVTDR